MDTVTTDVTKSSDVMNLLQLNASDDGQTDMANNLELFNVSLANAENDTSNLLESQSTIELNGERHVIVQETQDPETGEMLVVLKGENGNHIALPSSVIQSGIVQLAAENQLDILNQAQQELEQQPQEQQQPMDQAVEQQSMEQPDTDGVVNGDAPEETSSVNVPVLESEVQPEAPSQDSIQEGTTVAIIEDGGVATQDAVDGQVMDSSTVFTTDAASLEALVANAMASSAASGQDFVIMTEEAPTAEAVNVTEPVEIGGGDAVVYAEQVVENNSSTQYVSSNDPDEEMILNALSQSGTLQDGQIIHAVVDEKTIAYTINATESGFQLVQMGLVTESPRSSPKKGSPTRQPKQRPSPSGETLLVSTARTDVGNSGLKRKPGVARIGSKPNSYDNSRFMGKAVDSDSPSLLTATAPGPSQLASSRRTYSKKNVVWCNPESRSTKTSTAFSQATFPKTVARNTEITLPSTAAVSLPTIQQTTVSSSMKVAPVPTQSSSEKFKAITRAVSPAKILHSIVTPKVHPILIDDGKTLDEPSVQPIEKPDAETMPKSPAKKENGISLKPTPKPIEEVAPVKKGGRPRKSAAKVLESNEIETISQKEELKSVEISDPEKKEVTEEVPVVLEKERPSRARKPTPKVAAIASKTPSRDEKSVVPPIVVAPVAVAEIEPVAVVEEKVTPARVGSRKQKVEAKNEEVIPVQVGEATKEIEKKKIAKKVVEEKPVEEKPVEEKPVEEKAVEAKKEEHEIPKPVTSSEDESGTSGVKRSSRVPKRKSIDDDIFVPEKKPVPVSEKKIRIKEPEKKVSEKLKSKEKEIEESTPRKRVGFSAEVTKSDQAQGGSQAAKRGRSSSSEKKLTPSKQITPKKADVKPILKRTPGSHNTPVGRKLDKPIVATFSPVDSQVENKQLKDVIESLNDQRSPDQRYDITSPGCDIHIRHQSVSLTGYTPRGSESSYACQKCGFRTSRMNNLIIHHKEQCQVVKNAQMMSWIAEIRKQTKTPITPETDRRTSELSASSPDDEDGSPVPASSFTPFEPPAPDTRPSDIDADSN